MTLLNDKKAAAFEELLDIYRRLDDRMASIPDCVIHCRACGLCCRFNQYGHQLFVTPIEVDWLLRSDPPFRPILSTPIDEQCPWQNDAGQCVARTGRTFGCRAFFCDIEPPLDVDLERERLLRKIRELNARSGYDELYAPLGVIIQAITNRT